MDEYLKVYREDNTNMKVSDLIAALGKLDASAAVYIQWRNSLLALEPNHIVVDDEGDVRIGKRR